MFPEKVYSKRRRALISALSDRGVKDGILLFIGNDESPINYAANSYPFRQDSSWLYFFGIAEPSLTATLDLSDGSARLYGDDSSIEDRIWTGGKPSLRELAASSGVESTGSSSQVADVADKALDAGSPIRFLPPYREETAQKLRGLLHLAQGRDVRKRSDPILVRAVVGLREIKDELEIAEIEKAVGVSAEMHLSVMKALKPGWKESEAAAQARRAAEAAGCGISFATIATARGQVLHNHPTDYACRPGDIFLLDAGAEVPSGYAGDLTTVFPVGGAFSPRQADIYSLLLEVFNTASSSLSPGALFKDVHAAACARLAEGLVALGIMKGSPQDIVREGAHALFFPHGLGHMIGLDVHDMESLGEDEVGYGEMARSPQFGLSSLRLAKKLMPGMVHSVEPGIYFIPTLIEKWRSERVHAEFIRYDKLSDWVSCGGMRIEEDWTTTTLGARRLGPRLDKSLEAVQSARSAR